MISFYFFFPSFVSCTLQFPPYFYYFRSFTTVKNSVRLSVTFSTTLISPPLDPSLSCDGLSVLLIVLFGSLPSSLLTCRPVISSWLCKCLAHISPNSDFFNPSNDFDKTSLKILTFFFLPAFTLSENFHGTLWR